MAPNQKPAENPQSHESNEGIITIKNSIVGDLGHANRPDTSILVGVNKKGEAVIDHDSVQQLAKHINNAPGQELSKAVPRGTKVVFVDLDKPEKRLGQEMPIEFGSVKLIGTLLKGHKKWVTDIEQHVANSIKGHHIHLKKTAAPTPIPQAAKQEVHQEAHEGVEKLKGQVSKIRPEAYQLPTISGIDDIQLDIRISDLDALENGLKYNLDQSGDVAEQTKYNKEAMIAQYILYQVYENGRIPDLSTSAGNRITIDGREIHVGQNINIPAIYRDIAKEFFFDTEIAERITKGLAMNDDIYNASTREAYYNDTLLPLIKNQDDFVGYLQSQIENDGHKKILSLLEKNYPDAIKGLQIEVQGAISLNDEVARKVVNAHLEKNIPGYGKIGANLANFPPAAIAIGQAIAVVAGVWISGSKIGWGKTILGALALPYVNYAFTGHFNVFRTIGDSFKAVQGVGDVAIQHIKDMIESQEEERTDNPEVLAKIFLNTSKDFRDGDAGFYDSFGEPGSGGANDQIEARRLFAKTVVEGTPSINDMQELRQLVQDGRSKLVDRLNIVGVVKNTNTGKLEYVFRNVKSSLFDASGKLIAGYADFQEFKDANAVLNHPGLFNPNDTFQENYDRLRTQAGEHYDDSSMSWAKFDIFMTKAGDFIDQGGERAKVLAKWTFDRLDAVVSETAHGGRKIFLRLTSGASVMLDWLGDDVLKLSTGTETFFDALRGDPNASNDFAKAIRKLGGTGKKILIDMGDALNVWYENTLIPLMNKGGVLTDEVLQTYIMSAPSVVHQFFADMDIGLEWWPDSWPDLLSGGGDPDKFILPENTAEIPVKDAYHGLTDPAHVFIGAQMRFIESIGGKDDPKAAAPLKRMRTMLIHVYRKGGEDPTTNNNHDEITTIFDYYFGDGDETTDITTEEAWIDLVDDIKHTNFDDIDTNGKLYPDHEKISNLAPLMDALNALLAENPTGATEGKYAADESLLPEANGKPNILAPLDYFGQIDKGIGFNQAVTNGRIQSEMATKTVNDFKDFLESISFVDPDTLSSPEKEWCEHNKKAIEAMREELNK